MYTKLNNNEEKISLKVEHESDILLKRGGALDRLTSQNCSSTNVVIRDNCNKVGL